MERLAAPVHLVAIGLEVLRQRRPVSAGARSVRLAPFRRVRRGDPLAQGNARPVGPAFDPEIVDEVPDVCPIRPPPLPTLVLCLLLVVRRGPQVGFTVMNEFLDGEQTCC